MNLLQMMKTNGGGKLSWRLIPVNPPSRSNDQEDYYDEDDDYYDEDYYDDIDEDSYDPEEENAEYEDMPGDTPDEREEYYDNNY